MAIFKRSHLFQTIILGIHVSFRGCTLPETNSKRPWKWWFGNDPFLLGNPICRCELLVSGRVSLLYVTGCQASNNKGKNWQKKSKRWQNISLAFWIQGYIKTKIIKKIESSSRAANCHANISNKLLFQFKLQPSPRLRWLISYAGVPVVGSLIRL